jgi:molybdopterin-guanine dinucleotide biosynthesis protein A
MGGERSRPRPIARTHGRAVSAIWAVVLAGGESRRFGSDKLEARLGSLRLIERSISELPADAAVIIVGPVRERLFAPGRPVSYVRENPPGGGPAAAMIAGLASALTQAGRDDLVVVLPGDTPAAGRGAEVLLSTLRADPAAVGTIGADEEGREQPLQLALTRSAAERLLAAAGPERGSGASARAVVTTLGEGLRRVTLPPELHADIDTTADLDRWHRESPPTG